MTLSVIVPTTGRPSLRAALASIVAAGLAAGDEVLCVADGPCKRAQRLWQRAGLPGRYLETPQRAGNWGHGPRNLAMPLAHGDWLLFLDDDDAYLPSALATARMVLNAGPRRPHLFRLLHHMQPGGVLGAVREVRCGRVSTQMFAVPNDPDRLGTWGERYEGDWDFLESTLAHYPEGPVWRDEVLAEWNVAAAARLQEVATEERWRGAAGPVEYNRTPGLLELVREAHPRSVLEVGCSRGVSTEVWLLCCRQVVAVDSWEGEHERHYREFVARCGGYPGLRIHRGHSTEAARRYPDGAFDLVYIDADHSYESAAADIRAWRRKARRWLAGHDYAEGFPGVIRAVQELIADVEARETDPTRRAVRAMMGTAQLFEDSSWLVEV